MPWIEARHHSKCGECGEPIAPGDTIYYNGQPFCDAGCGTLAEEADKDNAQARRMADASRATRARLL